MDAIISIKTVPEFDRRAKRLAKKYPSLKEDLQSLAKSLTENPTQGTYLGKGGVYKIRMAVKSKGGGKSGGTRVLTYVVEELQPRRFDVTLLSIYDKSEVSNVSDAYISSLLEGL